MELNIILLHTQAELSVPANEVRFYAALPHIKFDKGATFPQRQKNDRLKFIL